MNLLRLIEFLRRHLKTVVRVCLVLLVLLVIADAVPALVDKHHAHTEARASARVLGGLRLSRLRADCLCLQGVWSRRDHDPGGLLR
jgi:hypothetical protein